MNASAERHSTVEQFARPDVTRVRKPMSTTTYRRPPREPGPDAPGGAIALQEPPEIPEPKKPSILGMLIMLPMMLGVGVGALVTLRGGSGSAASLSPIMMGASMGGMMLMGILRSNGGGDRKKGLNAARRDYLRHLSQVRRKVRRAALAQREAQNWSHPSADDLPNITESGRLWERRATDPDFGHIRVATGRQRLAVALETPQTQPVEDLEPLSVISLRRFIEAHHSVPELPVAASLRAYASILLRGTGEPVDSLARAMITQLAAMHSPQDLRIVVCAAPARCKNWEWMKWLPHNQHPSEIDAAGPVRLFAERYDDLEKLLGGADFAERARFAPKLAPPEGEPIVAILLDGVAIPSGSRFASSGFAGAAIIDVGGSLVPRKLDHVLEFEVTESDLLVISSDVGTAPRSIGVPARMGSETAIDVARSMSSYRMPVGVVESEAPLTTDIELHHLLGIDDPHKFDPKKLWGARSSWEELRIPVGVNESGAPMELDIKEGARGGSGPHGMLVGATGSGKSELLRTLVLALACTHSSDSLNFVLVDFKGGATFLGLESLPHTSAIITNLSDELSMVDRMQDAIHGELVRRQEVLRACAQPSRHDYEKARLNGADLEPLPSLVLVIDEFSELLSAKREFLELFVMVGRLGRSLGVHLLLSTQRLAEGRLGELSSHLSYRIGLKTFSAAESRAVLGVTDAYDVPLGPGGGFIKTDTETIERFKGAYISAPAGKTSRPTASVKDDEPATGIVNFSTQYLALPDPPDPTEDVVVEEEAPSSDDSDEPTLMDVLVSHLAEAGPPARKVWLPPLEVSPPINALVRGLDAKDGPLPRSLDGATSKLVARAGYIDKPFEQKWGYLAADLSSSGGHVGIGGGSQSGKSVMIQTLMMSLAVQNRPSEVQFFCLDFGGGSMKMLTGLPHVGAVAGRLESELVERVVGEMTNLLTRRENLFSEEGVDSIASYRERRGAGEFADEPYAPDVFLVIDGWFTVREDFEQLEDSVKSLVMRGLGFGIHVIVSTTRWGDLRPWLRDNLGTRFELRLGDPGDSSINAKAAATVPTQPGRGLTGNRQHFLVGLPRVDGSSEIADLPAAVRQGAKRVAAQWPDEHAPKIEMVPKMLPASRLPVPDPCSHSSSLVLPLGLATEDLAVVNHDFATTPHLVVIGDDEVGKTNLLQHAANAIVGTSDADGAQLVLGDYRRQLYSSVPPNYQHGYATAGAALKTICEELAEVLAERLPGPEITPDRLAARDWWSGPKYYVLIDDYDLVVTGRESPLSPLEEMLASGADIGLHLIIARAAAGANRAMMSDVLKRMTDLGTPTVLLSCPREEGMFGAVRATALAPGRAFYATRRSGRQLQTAIAESANDAQSQTLEPALQ